MLWVKGSKCFNFFFTKRHKILDWPRLKAFADEFLKVAQITKFVPDGLENIVGKAENEMLVTSIFSFSNNVSKSLPLQGC